MLARPAGLRRGRRPREDWQEALDDVDWETGDVLVVGSSSIGPLARVFLGPHSEKIGPALPRPGRRGAARVAAAT